MLTFTKSESFLDKLQSTLNTRLPVKFTFFTVEHVENKSKIIIKNIVDEKFKIKYRTLFGVPGNQFYFYYKKYILNEPVEIRDLYFWNDNKLAIWVMDPEHEPVDQNIIDEALQQANI